MVIPYNKGSRTPYDYSEQIPTLYLLTIGTLDKCIYIIIYIYCKWVCLKTYYTRIWEMNIHLYPFVSYFNVHQGWLQGFDTYIHIYIYIHIIITYIHRFLLELLLGSSMRVCQKQNLRLRVRLTMGPQSNKLHLDEHDIGSLEILLELSEWLDGTKFYTI